ncbi:MAG: predicted Zn-dependent peptidases [Candidatus Improbicoccus devescovinae]|nr:MAG: predicted Zn-dependent peptidases [Candidatus Improbicoccus devescovinae]
MKNTRILNENIISSSGIDEKYFFIKHESGLSIYLHPKVDYNSAYAIFGSRYGSINEVYKNAEDKIIKTPAGVAHYLEHKLFESEECDAFKLYAKTGASANAYTSYDKTAYLFSCNENFMDSFKILVNFVQEPYFTNENVEKEREIIAQEIKMYEDNPSCRVNLNMLKSLYQHHPVRNDIAGTIESISQINPEILYNCYNSFYNLNNMVLCIVGNFDSDLVLEYLQKSLKTGQTTNLVKAIFPDEPDSVSKSFISEEMEVLTPIFNLGFKQKINTTYLSPKEMIASEIALCALTLKSNKLYNELINKELINNSSFSCENFVGPNFFSTIFSGESKDPQCTAEIIYNHTEKLMTYGLERDIFERAKKCIYAESISSFNNISNIANMILDFYFSGYEMFDFIENISNIKLDELNYIINNKFRRDHSTLSVINSIKK